MDVYTALLREHPNPPDELLQGVRLLIEDFINEDLPVNYTLEDFCAHLSQLDMRHQTRCELVLEMRALLDDN